MDEDAYPKDATQHSSVRADGMKKATVKKKYTFCEFLINFMQSNQKENGSARDGEEKDLN